ncbi:hypothetical protein [Glycomyces terrestris]|uniref:Uncharacterized protein n=1 Tax=Glycomyces terrestris TaxID=2493553 RepID=A0A426UWC6_9ACTN|nr:hypothetical protein [Glycomyces terrestris]RRR98624.1 hypothetical protein EIW28_17315 [Glycomyces terrestris]
MNYNPPQHYSFGDPEPQQPQSGPPSYGPQSAPPAYSPAPPAPAGYVPTQPAPPMPTQPMMAAGPPPQRRSPIVPVLAVAAVVGFAGAAVSLALWLRTSGDLEDANAQLDDRDAEVAQLQEDLDAAETQVSELEVEAADAESMRSCLDDLAWYYATEAGSEEETQAELALQESCATWLW